MVYIWNYLNTSVVKYYGYATRCYDDKLFNTKPYKVSTDIRMRKAFAWPYYFTVRGCLRPLYWFNLVTFFLLKCLYQVRIVSDRVFVLSILRTFYDFSIGFSNCSFSSVSMELIPYEQGVHKQIRILYSIHKLKKLCSSWKTLQWLWNAEQLWNRYSCTIICIQVLNLMVSRDHLHQYPFSLISKLTDSDYPFGIFKLTYVFWLSLWYLQTNLQILITPLVSSN